MNILLYMALSFSGPYSFDAFISFDRTDDTPYWGTPWVTKFAADFQALLTSRLGREARVYFVPFENGSQSEERDAALSSSWLLLPIISSSFITSERCQYELNGFLGSRERDRVLKVVVESKEEPLPLDGIKGYSFFKTTQGLSHAFMFEIGEREYYARVNELADDAAALLRGIPVSAGKRNTATDSMEVFLCHSSGDKPAVRSLRSKLETNGFSPWLDEEQLLPGQNWHFEIGKAIRRAGAIIVCLSNSSVGKEGYLQREIRMVLDRASEIPDGAIFLIPARLEDCKVPARLMDLQWVDLFTESGYDKLVQALRIRETFFMQK